MKYWLFVAVAMLPGVAFAQIQQKEPDPSTKITMTYGEFQSIIAAEIARVHASPALDNLKKQLTPTPEDKSK